VSFFTDHFTVMTNLLLRRNRRPSYLTVKIYGLKLSLTCGLVRRPLRRTRLRELRFQACAPAGGPSTLRDAAPHVNQLDASSDSSSDLVPDLSLRLSLAPGQHP
jgi:hypothetical protein